MYGFRDNLMPSLLSTYIIIGTVCFTNPGDVDACRQIIKKGLLSPADCSMRWQSSVYRIHEEIREKGLSLTHVEGYCIPVDPNIDTSIKLSYNTI
jgi:hypothetical protein|tara:strand:- start:4173 stop:4457 length:285 start_codon:yes stop_codon:yes gene_type:complete